MNTSQYKPNELEMAIRIAKKSLDRMLDKKPNGGLVVNKGQSTESKMSYKEAKLCLERIERMFTYAGSFSFGVCGECSKWNTQSHNSAPWGDFGTCKHQNKITHRYGCCANHSKENGGYGL